MCFQKVHIDVSLSKAVFSRKYNYFHQATLLDTFICLSVYIFYLHFNVISVSLSF